MDIDKHLTEWRNAHALMVHRMLGSKMGTGGSSGFHYLRTAAVHHKVFTDYFNLSTYMIPESNLPRLPRSIKSFMAFPSSPNFKSRGNPSRGNPKRYLSKELPPFPTLKATKSGSDLMLHIDRSKLGLSKMSDDIDRKETINETQALSVDIAMKKEKEISKKSDANHMEMNELEYRMKQLFARKEFLIKQEQGKGLDVQETGTVLDVQGTGIGWIDDISSELHI